VVYASCASRVIVIHVHGVLHPSAPAVVSTPVSASDAALHHFLLFCVMLLSPTPNTSLLMGVQARNVQWKSLHSYLLTT